MASAHRRARRAAADEHRGPAGTRRRDRLLPRVDAANRLEDEVVLAERPKPSARRAPAPGRGARGGGRTRARRGRRARAAARASGRSSRRRERRRPTRRCRARRACTQAASGSAIAAPAKSRPSGIACSAPDRRRDALGEAARAPTSARGRSRRARRGTGRTRRRRPSRRRGRARRCRRARRRSRGRTAPGSRRGSGGRGAASCDRCRTRWRRRTSTSDLAGGLVDLLDAQVVGPVEDRRAHHAAAPVRSSAARTRGHPPAELLVRPCALGRVGMDDRAVAEDPAVELQAGDQPEVEVALAHRAALGGQEVLEQLLVRGLRAPGVVAQVPRDLERRRALAGDVPVEQHDAPVDEAEVVVAQVAVDQRRAAGAQGLRQRLRGRRGWRARPARRRRRPPRRTPPMRSPAAWGSRRCRRRSASAMAGELMPEVGLQRDRAVEALDRGRRRAGRRPPP